MYCIKSNNYFACVKPLVSSIAESRLKEQLLRVHSMAEKLLYEYTVKKY